MPTNISWVKNPDGSQGETANPWSGCEHASRGCFRCYAEGIAENPRFSSSFPNGFGFTPRPGRFLLALGWRKPRGVFYWSMSDPFLSEVPTEALITAFAVMAASRRHHYMVLTKRHGPMRSIMNNAEFVGAVRAEAKQYGLAPDDWAWPLPNVRLGVSIEDQKHADLRLDALCRTPAAVHMLSVEPMLGPVDLSSWLPRLNNPWVIVGGESGKVNPADPWDAPDDSDYARPIDPEWIRGVVRAGEKHRAPTYVKQLGSVQAKLLRLKDRKGETPEEWPEHLADLRVRQFPAFGTY